MLNQTAINPSSNCRNSGNDARATSGPCLRAGVNPFEQRLTPQSSVLNYT
jgi:hypothetical protein